LVFENANRVTRFFLSESDYLEQTANQCKPVLYNIQPERFLEKTSFITKHLRLNNQCTMDSGFNNIHNTYLLLIAICDFEQIPTVTGFFSRHYQNQEVALS
jgi:hypothetical protein